MKTKYDCKIYVNGKQCIKYTATSFTAAFKIGVGIYNHAENDELDAFDGFIITYEDEVAALAVITFRSPYNYYYNTPEVGKLIKKYLPQLRNVNPAQTILKLF